MTKVSGSTTQEVGTLPEGIGQVSPLAVWPQLLIPPLCHAEAWQPFLTKDKNSRIFQSPHVVNVASLPTPIIMLSPSHHHHRPEIHFTSRRLTLPRLESLYIALPRFTSSYSYRIYSLPQPASPHSSSSSSSAAASAVLP